jgi:hypothetical protein
MPLGGYCEQCQGWVWVSFDGRCENGHPAASVRDIQQLSPQREVTVEMPEPVEVGSPRPSSRYRFWWRHSMWLLWTFTFGLFNWVAFIYIGVRARKAQWIAAGFVYLLPLIATIASIGTDWLRIALPVQVLVAALSVVHAFAVRPQYRAIMFGDARRPGLVSPPQPPALMPPLAKRALPRGTSEDAAALIEAAHDKLRLLQNEAAHIGKPVMRGKIAGLVTTGDRILNELAQRPGRTSAARPFLTYYVDVAARIVARYVDLSERRVNSAEVNDLLARAEASLDSVQAAFDHQLEALLSSDVIDLDSEITLLEKMVDSEAGLRDKVKRQSRTISRLD